jgi:hypothetical protein
MMAENVNVSRWFEPFSKPHPKVMLHGIEVRFCRCGCGEEDLIIPAIGRLLACSKENPDCTEFQWLEEDRKWVAIRV